MSEMLVWMDGPADGPTNMAADEVLAAEAVRCNLPLIRFYQWASMTLSLGAFQPLAQAQAESSVASLPLVRRPSGGGGIIHGSDLTYAVAVPRSHAWAARPQVLYDAFHDALVQVLAMREIPASLHPGRAPDAHDDRRLFCFERRARGDVIVPGPTIDGHKILGSAQRRLSGAVLQHGSLLLHTPRWNGTAATYPGLTDIFTTVALWSPTDLAAEWLATLSQRTGTPVPAIAPSFATAHAAEISAAASRFCAVEWLARR